MRKSLGLKEEIALKHGFLKGLNVMSNIDAIENSFYACMDEYAEAYHKQVIEETSKSEFVGRHFKSVKNIQLKHKIKEIEDYLSDMQNLIDTEHFQDINISECVFNHKGITLKEFVKKGNVLIFELLKLKSTPTELQG